ncbi:hypothetical protein ACIQWA_34800 [Kitasatospora sp. NPDC098652]|uniref:hypothetical protein n=1 Tax=Kitasatospora sp. NPDC098652 TaxID=3364095 RepID=UPI0038139004
MKKTTSPTPTVQPPEVTEQETRTALLTRAKRKAAPYRKTFVQAHRGGESRHGPLKHFVNNRDLRGAKAYLIIVAACSRENADGWTTTLDSMVWARLIDTTQTATGQSARTAAWRTLQRLQKMKLIKCSRPHGSTKISVTLLREDGSGLEYTRPDGKVEADRFLQIPITFWTKGYDTKIDLPALALFLVIAREKPWSPFPAEPAPERYGWSADTHLRGLQKLLALGLVERRETYLTTPLSPTGRTLVYQYRLASAMRVRKQKQAAAPS